MGVRLILEKKGRDHLYRDPNAYQHFNVVELNSAKKSLEVKLSMLRSWFRAISNTWERRHTNVFIMMVILSALNFRLKPFVIYVQFNDVYFKNSFCLFFLVKSRHKVHIMFYIVSLVMLHHVIPNNKSIE